MALTFGTLLSSQGADAQQLHPSGLRRRQLVPLYAVRPGSAPLGVRALALAGASGAERKLRAALEEAGSLTVSGEMPSIAALLQQTGLVSSLSEARRTVKEGGAYLNNQRVSDADSVPTDDDWLPGGWLVLRRGKRSVAGVRRAAG